MDLLAFLLVAALVFGGGVVFGRVMAEDSTTEGHEHLTAQDAAIRADMDALTRAEQLNSAFLAARGAMWDEARRHVEPQRRL